MGIQHSLTNQSNFFLLSILSLFYFPTVYPLISSTFKKSISFNPTPNTPIKMQYTLSTASALLAALSLTSAAPMPSTSTSTSSSSSGSSSSSKASTPPPPSAPTSTPPPSTTATPSPPRSNRLARGAPVSPMPRPPSPCRH